MKPTWEQRLRIAVAGNLDQRLFTSTGVLFSQGFDRVVLGGRGPYVEFKPRQIVCKTVEADEHHYYYLELRSVPDAIKVYDQLHTVGYADYLVGKLYVSPFDLFLDSGERAIEAREDRQGRLF